MDWQIRMYKRVTAEYFDDIPLILYLTGNDPEPHEWNESVRNGTATVSIMTGTDNKAVIRLADKYDCLLQYTALPFVDSLIPILKYMHDTNRQHIPIIGENTHENTRELSIITRRVEQYGLLGLDYMIADELYRADGRTKTANYDRLKAVMPRLKRTVENPVPWTPSTVSR